MHLLPPPCQCQHWSWCGSEVSNLSVEVWLDDEDIGGLDTVVDGG